MTDLEKQAMQMFPPLKEYLPKRGETYDINESHRTAFIMGANWQKEQIIKSSSQYWYDHLKGFLGEGLAKGVISEYEKHMKGE